MAYELLGKNFTPPDVQAKVTGKAKYAEDFRVDGMVFCKLLTSPMPHARVTSIDASAALAMPGVHGVLTADDVPSFPAPQETILTNEPLFVGHPILARRGRHRGARERRAREDQGDVRGAAVHGRSAAEPVPGRPERAHERQRRESGRRPQDVQVDRARLRRRGRRAAAEGRAGHANGRSATSTPASRRAKLVLDESFVTAGLGASLDGAAQRARVLAERQVLFARLDAEPELPDSRHRALLRHRAGGSRLTSRSSAAAGSARRAAPIR